MKDKFSKIKDTIKRIYENKTLMRILWIVCLILFVVMFARYKKYKSAKLYFNHGVKEFNEGDYDQAEVRFTNSLFFPHTKGFECKARINAALSIVAPITPESVTEDNIDECIASLEKARDFLTENDCAHADDSEGHNRKAQKLKEEIDDYIEQLKEQKKQQEEEKKKEEDKKKSEEEKNKEQEEEKKRQEEEKRKEEEEKKRKEEEKQKLKEQLEQIEQQGMSEREEKMSSYQTYETSDVYYSGKSW